MSDYHIRSTEINLKSVNTVFHIPIPAENNAVGVSWQAALALSISWRGRCDNQRAP